MDRLREEDATKEEEKRQREAAKAVRGERGAGEGRGISGRMARHGDVAIGVSEKVRSQVLHKNHSLTAALLLLHK